MCHYVLWSHFSFFYLTHGFTLTQPDVEEQFFVLGLMSINYNIDGHQMEHKETPWYVGLLWMSCPVNSSSFRRCTRLISCDREPEGG